MEDFEDVIIKAVQKIGEGIEFKGLPFYPALSILR